MTRPRAKAVTSTQNDGISMELAIASKIM